MGKWMHCRQGLIEGEIVGEDDEWVDIKLSARARVTWGSNLIFAGHGRSYSTAEAGCVIRCRKSLLTEVMKGAGDNG